MMRSFQQYSGKKHVVKNDEILHEIQFSCSLSSEVPTSQMQHNADYKETDQKDQCFL